MLASTFSLGIDVATSDLDIICEIDDPLAFEKTLRDAFGHHTEFSVQQKTASQVPRVVATFRFREFPIEIFGEQQPVEQQNAYRHMVVCAQLLALGGESARRAIQRLKAAGVKTEPAFAQYFKLDGDPYQVLLALFTLTEAELRRMVARAISKS